MIEPYVWELEKCDKPDCLRKVKKGTDYCCTACRVAAEGQYEIDEHSAGCEKRHAERGDYGAEWRP